MRVAAGEAARKKCRDGVGSRIRRTVAEATAGDWQDAYIAGIDEYGSPAARVEGTVRANKPDGISELHHYDCSLSDYDMQLGTWSVMSTSGGKVGS